MLPPKAQAATARGGCRYRVLTYTGPEYCPRLLRILTPKLQREKKKKKKSAQTKPLYAFIQARAYKVPYTRDTLVLAILGGKKFRLGSVVLVVFFFIAEGVAAKS